MAGYAPISLQQRVDRNGKPFPGAKAYFYEADSLLPITVYQDYSLGTAHPNPVAADAYGVFPPIFLDEADEFYRIRITTASGIVLTDLSTLPVIGPSGGGGGSEVPVDQNALFQTGDPLWVPVSGSRPGFVRLNGRTIGSATSGAAERANADCENLYIYNWTTFSNDLCPVTGGRGVSAAADWAASKPIQVLDMRNKGPFGLAGMGNTETTVFDGITFAKGDSNTAASTAGAAKATIAQTNLPSVAFTVTIPAGQGSHTHTGTLNHNVGNQYAAGDSFTPLVTGTGAITGALTVNAATLPAMTGTAASGGSGAAVDKLPPLMLGTWYQKL